MRLLLEKVLSALYLLNQWPELDQTVTGISLGGGGGLNKYILLTLI